MTSFLYYIRKKFGGYMLFWDGKEWTSDFEKAAMWFLKVHAMSHATRCCATEWEVCIYKLWEEKQ